MKKVTIYSTPTCHYCLMLKEFLDSKGVKYENFDVSSNLEKRKEMMDKSGQMGVPVVFVEEEMIVGFNEDKLTELLG
jgi:glutaredoxin 3